MNLIGKLNNFTLKFPKLNISRLRFQDPEGSREAREVGAGEERARGKAEGAHRGETVEGGGAGETEA